MQSVRQILVAVKDPAAKSLPAVTKAAQLARAWNARLELFHAIDIPIYTDAYGLLGYSPVEIQSDWRRRYLEQLEQIAARLRRRGLQATVAAEWDYPVYEAIIRRAGEIGADLIVAERHARRHVAPWLLHMTDWELLRLSTIPVLLVKSPRPYRHPTVLAAVDPSRDFSKPGELDEEILRISDVITEALQGKLHAVHAYVPLMVGMPPDGVAPPSISEQAEARIAREAEAGFERLLQHSSIPPERRHLVGRLPADAIREVAEDIDATIVVMGAVSRSGLERIFVGNTAERVLDRLRCDLLIVKPPRFPSRVQRMPRGVRLTASAALP